MLQVILLLLENKPGALMRVTVVLTARGYNIETLTVARTLDPELSRMTIVVDVDPTLRAQVIKQMNKLVNVLQAVDLTEAPAVCRDLVLIRVRAPLEMRTIADSVSRTGALLTLEEGQVTCGVGLEVIGRVHELLGPIPSARIGALPAPVSSNMVLEAACLPDAPRVLKAVKMLLGKRSRRSGRKIASFVPDGQ